MDKHVPLTIIMIEDDEGHATLIERNIRRAGVNNEIIKFGSGKPALDYLVGGGGKPGVENGRPYMVLLDLNLPDMSGVEILRRLKETPKTERIPVVVLTTTDDKAEIQRWLTEREFVELLTIGQLLPGPNVLNLTVMAGHRLGGLRGAQKLA